MDEVRKFLVKMFAICLQIVVTVAVMIKGWGVEPQSWWWIIGAYFVGHTIAAIVFIIGQSDEQKK